MRNRFDPKAVANRQRGLREAKAADAKRSGVESHVSKINREAREALEKKQ